MNVAELALRNQAVGEHVNDGYNYLRADLTIMIALKKKIMRLRQEKLGLELLKETR